MCVYIVQCVIYPWYHAFSAEAQRPWSSFQPFVSLRGCLANGLQSWENSGRVIGVMYLWDTLWDSHLGWFNGDKWWFNGDKWSFNGDKWWFNGDKWWFYGDLPLVNMSKKRTGKYWYHNFFDGELSTISMAVFKSFWYVYQRVMKIMNVPKWCLQCCGERGLTMWVVFRHSVLVEMLDVDMLRERRIPLLAFSIPKSNAGFSELWTHSLGHWFDIFCCLFSHHNWKVRVIWVHLGW